MHRLTFVEDQEPKSPINDMGAKISFAIALLNNIKNFRILNNYSWKFRGCKSCCRGRKEVERDYKRLLARRYVLLGNGSAGDTAFYKQVYMYFYIMAFESWKKEKENTDRTPLPTMPTLTGRAQKPPRNHISMTPWQSVLCDGVIPTQADYS